MLQIKSISQVYIRQIYIFIDQMSYLYSPLKSQFRTVDASEGQKVTKKGQKHNNDFDNYEDQLDKYGKINRSHMSDWDSLDTRQLLSPTKRNNKSNAGNQYKYEQSNASSSRMNSRQNGEHQSNNNVSKYLLHDDANYTKISQQQLEKELKKMRLSLLQLNQKINQKLTRYQLVDVSEFKSAQTIKNTPQKEVQIIKKEIETNIRIISAQEKQLKNINNTYKQYQERDYLIELEERASQLQKEIWDKKKQKKHVQVQVQKLDNALIFLKDQKYTDEFKNIKVLKHQILHHFKKFHENRAKQQELDRATEEITKKDQEIANRLKNLMQIVHRDSMEVRANRPFLQIKKQYKQLLLRHQAQRKKIQVIKRSQKINEQKIEREICSMGQQCRQSERRTKNLEQMLYAIIEKTDICIQQNKVASSLIRNIAYKFGENVVPIDRYFNRNKPNLNVRSIQNPQGEASLSSYSKDVSYATQNKAERSATQKKLFKIRKTRNPSAHNQSKILLNDKNTIQVPEQFENSTVLNTKPLLKIKREYNKNQINRSIHSPLANVNDSIAYKPPIPRKIGNKQKNQRTIG